MPIKYVPPDYLAAAGGGDVVSGPASGDADPSQVIDTSTGKPAQHIGILATGNQSSGDSQTQHVYRDSEGNYFTVGSSRYGNAIQPLTMTPEIANRMGIAAQWNAEHTASQNAAFGRSLKAATGLFGGVVGGGMLLNGGAFPGLSGMFSEGGAAPVVGDTGIVSNVAAPAVDAFSTGTGAGTFAGGASTAEEAAQLAANSGVPVADATAAGGGISGTAALSGAGAAASLAKAGGGSFLSPTASTDFANAGNPTSDGSFFSPTASTDFANAASGVGGLSDLFSGASILPLLGGMTAGRALSGKGLGTPSSTTTTATAAMSPEERALIALQTQIAQQQLGNLQATAPLNQKLIALSMANLASQADYQKALDAAISPEELAAQAKAQFDQATTTGNINAQIAQKQLDLINQGTRATPEQLANIQAASDAAIKAGTGDIDTQTQRGIGMISDELANARGLRLSDSPISSEAALLTRAAGDQKSSLINAVRSNQANAVLNYPMAAASLQSGIDLNTQNTNQAFTAFQNQLRQQAATNRMALTGPSITSGLGLSSIGGGNQALGALNNTQSKTVSSNQVQGLGFPGIASAIGALAPFAANG